MFLCGWGIWEVWNSSVIKLIRLFMFVVFAWYHRIYEILLIMHDAKIHIFLLNFSMGSPNYYCRLKKCCSENRGVVILKPLKSKLLVQIGSNIPTKEVLLTIFTSIKKTGSQGWTRASPLSIHPCICTQLLLLFRVGAGIIHL